MKTLPRRLATQAVVAGVDGRHSAGTLSRVAGFSPRRTRVCLLAEDLRTLGVAIAAGRRVLAQDGRRREHPEDARC